MTSIKYPSRSNMPIEESKDNDVILTQFLLENIRQAQEARYGKPCFEFRVTQHSSAQDIINEVNQDERKLW